MALLGALLLVFINCIRPQEFVPVLGALHILNVATVLAVLGIAVDVGTGKLKSLWLPQIPYLLAFIVWCVTCTFIKAHIDPVTSMREKLGFSTLVLLILAYACASFARYRSMAVMLVGVASLLAFLGIRQGSSPLECIVLEVDENGVVETDRSSGTPNGLFCEGETDCAKQTHDFKTEFACEKPGFFGTFSVDHGRVRWRGTLADPNELAMFIGASISFLFAIHATSRNPLRHLVFVAVLAAAFGCVVQTGSRSGQLVFVAIFVTYFVRRYGAKGLLVAGVLAAPVIMLGGRNTEGAEASALERLGALYDGMDFVRQNPILGFGMGQFDQNYFITAHNSYVLAAAELGIPGMLIWSCLIYTSIKIPYLVGAHPPPGMDPRFVPFGFALMTSFAGLLIGIFFLSFCYDTILFTYLGLSGALFLAVKKSAPEFNVKISGKEIGMLAGIDVGILTLIFVYTRIKGAP